MENRVFSPTHPKKLVNDKEYDKCNTYISTYFFKSGINCYFRNGNADRFDCYTMSQAMDLIPEDLKAYHKNVIFYMTQGST